MKSVGILRIQALFAVCALVACAQEEAPVAGTVLVTFGQESAEWAKVATLRVTASGGASSRTLFEGPVEGAAIDLGEAAPDATLMLEAEARDAVGTLVARGRTVSFVAAELVGETVPLQLSPIGGSSRAAAGLLAGRTRRGSGGSALLQSRYLLLANADGSATNGELYDLGLLTTLVGGPSWPRPPRTVLRAAGHDLLVLDENGASFVDVFTSSVAATSSLAADDAAALIDGQVLEGARATDAPDTPTGRWLAGPCRRRGEGVTASDRVLYLSANDTLVVSRLATPRLGASCAVGAGGALLIAGGGADVLASIDPQGKVTELPLVDDRAFGAALVGEDGSLSLLGGRTASGDVAAPARVAFPCTDRCVAVPSSFGPLALDTAMLDLEALPASVGHAFLLADDGQRTRIFAGAATAIETKLAEITTRRLRTSAEAFVLAGDRLALVGGNDASGPVLDVELLTPP